MSSIKPAQLGEALAEILGQYKDSKVEQVNAAGERAIKKLVKLTKKTAPKDSGDFAKHLTYKETQMPMGDKEYTWGASAPKHRVTHLLVHGHATVNGGRVEGSSFLSDALAEVLPEYEREVEEAVQNAN